MGLCPKNTPQEVLPSKEVVTCVACEFIMKQLKDILQDRNDEVSLKKRDDRIAIDLLTPVNRILNFFSEGLYFSRIVASEY